MIWFRVNLAQAKGDFTSNSLFHNTKDTGVEGQPNKIYKSLVTDFFKVISSNFKVAQRALCKVCLGAST